ncbi:MAG: YgfZ/GcvT domain-containing protein [Parahaliea sp.]
MPAHYSSLDHECLLAVSGPDAATFLQGQATCDVREVNTDSARPGAWCNPQGRILADFLLAQPAPEHFLLRLHADIADTTRERLGKYIVFSKARLERSDWRVFGCWGDTVRQRLGQILAELPDARYHSRTGEGYCVVQMDEAASAFELYLAPQRSELATTLTQTLEPAPASQWQALQIAAGLGRVEAATVETFLPQMLNYDLEGLVNFKKGCYTGQEVIARLHYKGTPKRRMYLASCREPAPAAGTEIFAEGERQAVGTVVNAISIDEQQTALLVVLALKSTGAALHLGGAEGPLLALSEPEHFAAG